MGWVGKWLKWLCVKEEAALRRHQRPVLRKRGKRLAASLAAMALIAVGLFGPSGFIAPANAAPGDPFDTTRASIFISQATGNDGVRLYRAEADGNGTYSFSPEGPTSSLRYNAIGMHENGYIYGAVTRAGGGIPINAVVRIGQGGVVTQVGNATFPRVQWTGAIGDDGYLYTTNGRVNDVPNSGTVYRVNVTNGQITAAGELPTNVIVADWVYSHGYFWGFSYIAGNMQILRFDPTTGSSSLFPAPSQFRSGPYGAAWKFGNGNLAFSHNESGEIIQVRITNPTSATPGFEVVNVVAGPPSSVNDGTAIPGDPVDLAVTKDGPATFTPGERISYDLTITNNGPGESSGWVISDQLPANLTNIAVDATVECVVDEDEITCSGGRLDVGESRTITVSGDTAASERACFTNVVSVLGNELDPEDANNEDSVENCPRLIELTKTSDGSESSRPGDQVEYTVTATNVGASPYTEDDPAVVLDDLSEVLDDATFNDDLSASLPGTLTSEEPLLGWAGALAPGQSVELTYSVTLTDAGDRETRNVTWVPNDPSDPEPPICDPVVDGRDEVTGEPCAVHEFLLPALTVTKSASSVELPAIGAELSYTVTVTNPGPGDYTQSAPATLTDDLTEVLDDATWNNDAIVTPSQGDLDYNQPELTWSGPLAAGESVEITYSVTYMGGGDSVLTNTACVPASDVPAGAAPCAEVTVPGADIGVTKSSTPESGTTVNAGEEVTYTLTFTNAGAAAGAVNYEDVLSNVLDDATLEQEPAASDPALTVSAIDPATGRFTITGTLDAKQSVTVSYSVRVNPEDQRGDNVLANFVVAPGEDPPSECAPGQPCTEHPIPLVTVAKSSTPDSGTDVSAGDEVTYTLTFSNSGTADGAVAFDDVIAGVLDDATLVSGPTSSASALVASEVSDGRFSVSGTLAPEQVVTVSYTVEVNQDGDRGDNVLGNFVVPVGEDPPADCEPGNTLCTEHSVPGDVVVAKSVDPDSGSDVVPGQELTYSLSFTHTGGLPVAVDYTDYLAGVLDDATVSEAAVVSPEGGLVVERVGDTWVITGEVSDNATVTVTYTATVLESGFGDGVLGNFVRPSADDPPVPGEECEADDTSCTFNPVPGILEIEKIVDVDGPVDPGAEVGYTLVFRNVGGSPVTVEHTDDLRGVIDDADITVEPAANHPGLMIAPTPLGDADFFTVSGTLPANEDAEVTYSASVRSDSADRGDNQLLNVVVPGDEPPAEPPTTCDPVVDVCTQTPIGELAQWKTVEADQTPVAEGTVLTYTLHFANRGGVVAPVDAVDHLVHVLDDADLTGGPTTSDGLNASVRDDIITITGAVPVGETSTVTYQVTIKPDGERGDNIAANFLLPPDQEPPTDPVCQPTDGEEPHCTATPVGELLVRKAVAAQSTPIVSGTALTYTLTFDNQGQGPVAVNYTDHLAEVLDDAELSDGPTSSDAALTVVQGADTLEITGELAAGQTVTVTYEVIIKPVAERGNNSADNFLVPNGEGPPEECDPGTTLCTVTPLPALMVEKASDPDSGEAVQAGDEVTYTLTFTNSGEVSALVDMSDHLVGVLDDAELTGAPVASDNALEVSDGATGTIRITGEVDPGQTVTITYTVTVRPDGERGDNLLGNVVAATGVEDPSCDDEGTSCTEHPVGELALTKSVDPASGSTLAPGQVATYTLTFTNTGKASVAVNHDDVLVGVLDDADITTAPTATAGSLDVSALTDGRFTISGSLDPGVSESVTYEVTVREDGERGDDRLANFLVPAGETPPEGPCDVDSPAPCTVNHVSDVSVTKSSDPASGSEVSAGDVVTYTITFANGSKNSDAAAAEVAYTDHMSDVLDDAVLVGSPVASEGLTATVEGDTIVMAGNVAPGETLTVSYIVQVKEDADRGNGQLGNVVAVTGESPVCAEGSQLCTEHPITFMPPTATPPPSDPATPPSDPATPAPGDWLPVTGAAVLGIGVLALLSIGLGVLFLGERRRLSGKQ